MYIVRVVF